MLYWIIQVIIMSTLLIFLVHHLINFLRDTLTVPKVKDLVNVPTKKYDEIYGILNNSSDINIDNNFNGIDFDSIMNTTTSIDNIGNIGNIGNNHFVKNKQIDNFLPNSNVNDMKNDLKNFIKTQFNK